MIRLFESTETEFETFGLGSLDDAIECKVTEERNGQFELSMQYPVNGKHYNDLAYDRLVFCKPNPYADPQAFQIYKIQNGLHGTAHVWAEHISYRLSKIGCAPFSASDCKEAFEKLPQAIAGDCPFTFSPGGDKGSVHANYNQKRPSSVRSRLGGEEGSFLDVYRGEYEFDNFKVTLWTNRGKDRGIRIRYGKNLTDFDQERNIQETYTAVYPYYYGTAYTYSEEGYDDEGEETLITLDPPVLTLEQIAQEDPNFDYTNPFGYEKVMPLDLTDKFEVIPTAQELKAAAIRYVKANNVGIPKVSIKFSFAGLRQVGEGMSTSPLEQVRLCDTVTVVYPELNVQAHAKVIKTVYNVLTDRYETIEIGDAKEDVASTIVSQGQSIQQSEARVTSAFEQEMNRLSGVFDGGYFGDIVFMKRQDGSIYEIRAINGDNILRINSAGIATSTEGMNGSFNIVWDLAGRTFNSENVRVIHLNADDIEAGRISDGTGNNFWDLDTGELHIGDYADPLNDNTAELQNITNILDMYSQFLPDTGESIAIGDGTSIMGGLIDTEKVAIKQTLSIGNHIWLSRSNGTNTTLVYAGGN